MTIKVTALPNSEVSLQLQIPNQDCSNIVSRRLGYFNKTYEIMRRNKLHFGSWFNPSPFVFNVTVIYSE